MKNLEKCCVEGCKRNVRVVKHQLCSAHYIRFLKFGEPGLSKVRKRIFRPPYNPKIAFTE